MADLKPCPFFGIAVRRTHSCAPAITAKLREMAVAAQGQRKGRVWLADWLRAEADRIEKEGKP